MLRFSGNGATVHADIPVRRAKITPDEVWTADYGVIARALENGTWQMLDSAPLNLKDVVFKEVEPFRLMPNGSELEEALARFEPDQR